MMPVVSLGNGNNKSVLNYTFIYEISSGQNFNKRVNIYSGYILFFCNLKLLKIDLTNTVKSKIIPL